MRRYFKILFCFSIFITTLFPDSKTSAQQFGTFRGPAGGAMLVDFWANTVTNLGGIFDGHPLVLELNGLAYVFVVGRPGVSPGVWFRTQTYDWVSWGGNCSKIRSIRFINGDIHVEAFCPDDREVWERSYYNPWRKSSTPVGLVSAPTVPEIVNGRYASIINSAGQAYLVDLTGMTVTRLWGAFDKPPTLVIMNNTPYLIGVATDNVLYYRTPSLGWTSLGTAPPSITSINLTANGQDIEIIGPSTSRDKLRRRTLTTAWQTISIDQALAGTGIAQEPRQVAPTGIDEYLASFYDTWGADTEILEKAKTQSAFDAAYSTLNITALEAKISNAFKSSLLGGTISRLAVAYPRSKISDGAALAMKSSLQTLAASLAADRNTVLTLFESAIKNFPGDPASDQRATVLDLFAKIPGVSNDLRTLTKSLILDPGLATNASLAYAGKQYFVMLLVQTYLGTNPDPTEAKQVVTAALKIPLEVDQKASVQNSLDNYLEFAEGFLNCTAGKCSSRATKDAACSASNPCILGLQCSKGTCVDFGEIGARCGQGYPLCHPTLTCNGDTYDLIRTCVTPAKVGESCKDRACDPSLSCLKRTGACVDLAELNESCSLISKPCRDGRTMSCSGGYCRAKGTLNAECKPDLPCLNDFYCSSTTTTPGKCLAKILAGQACTASTPCVDGYGCQVVTGVVGATGSTCQRRAQLGEACGGTSSSAFCDNTIGLICGESKTCRYPGKINDVCIKDYECSSGLYCTGKNSVGNSTCQPPGDVGATCFKAEHCNAAKEALCDTTTQKCYLKGGLDAPCPCRAGFKCMQASATAPFLCKPESVLGSFCGNGSPPCGPNLVCVGGGISTPGICKLYAASGEYCSSASNQLYGAAFPPCQPGLRCRDWDLRCGVGFYTEGQRCTSNDQCAEGLACNFTLGIGQCTSKCNWFDSKSVVNTCAFSDFYACRKDPSSFVVETYACVRKLDYGAPCRDDYNKETPPCGHHLFCHPTLKRCEFMSRPPEACRLDGTAPCIPGASCHTTQLYCYQ